MSPSKMKYKEAVKTGRDHGMNSVYAPPKHFDERQMRLYDKHFHQTKNKCDWFDYELEIMANAYGHTYTENSEGKKVLVRLEEK